MNRNNNVTVIVLFDNCALPILLQRAFREITIRLKKILSDLRESWIEFQHSMA